LFIAWNIFNSYVYGYRIIAFQKYFSPNITCKTVGWPTDGVGQGYGSGYPLNVLLEWFEKVI